MELQIFSIKDNKAEVFNSPFYMKTKGEALRAFDRTVNDPKTQINEYPKDFDLYVLGTFHSDTGKIKPIDPKHIAEAISFLKKEE